MELKLSLPGKTKRKIALADSQVFKMDWWNKWDYGYWI